MRQPRSAVAAHRQCELTLVAGAPANGGSCVAHHEGRVVFVRYALPGERVRVRVTADRGSYWHAEVIEVIEPSADRIESLCPIAGVDGAGCCDLAFAAPEAARALKAQVVANQLERLGGHRWSGEAEPLSDSGPTGWRTRVRLEVGADRRPGFHRYHSDELVTDLRCAQLPAGMLDGLAEACSAADLAPTAQLHVAVDDDGERHVVRTLRQGRRTATKVVQGGYEAVQRVGAAQLAGAGDGVLAGAPRRGAGLQRSGRRLGTARRRHDGLGSLRRRGRFRRDAGRRGGGVRAGAHRRHLARGDAGRPGRTG